MQRERKITLLSTLLCILLTALTAGAATLFPEYSLILSLFCTAALIIPFFVSFESKKPKSRQIVPIAVISAAAVVGRWIFAFIPSVQPATALIIIAGCLFGPTEGFITGSVVAIVSNMLLGQGPFTPWQMLCWGLCGAVGGLLYRGKLGAFFKLPAGIAAYGFVAGILYGQIMNLQFFLGYTDKSVTSLFAAATASIPTDLMHAVSNAVVLALTFSPMRKIFERIKVKYGL